MLWVDFVRIGRVTCLYQHYAKLHDSYPYRYNHISISPYDINYNNLMRAALYTILDTASCPFKTNRSASHENP